MCQSSVRALVTTPPSLVWLTCERRSENTKSTDPMKSIACASLSAIAESVQQLLPSCTRSATTSTTATTIRLLLLLPLPPAASPPPALIHIKHTLQPLPTPPILPIRPVPTTTTTTTTTAPARQPHHVARLDMNARLSSGMRCAAGSACW